MLRRYDFNYVFTVSFFYGLTHTPPQYSCSVTATVALSNRTENTTTTTERWAEQRNRDNYTKYQRAQKPHVEILVFQFNQS